MHLLALQSNNTMANQTVYPYGTGGSLPSSIGIINDRTTGGADKAWSAEQGKLAGQEIDKNTEDLFSMFATDINNSSYTEQVGWTILSTNLWQHVTGAQASNYGCILIPITPGMRYRVYGNTTGTIIAVLASNSMVADASPDFCTGYNGRIGIAIGGVYDFIAPEDAKYLYLLIRTSGVERDGYVRYSDAELPKVSEELNDIDGQIDLINSQKIDITTMSTIDGWIINSSNNWYHYSSSADQAKYKVILIPITPGKKYVAYANSDWIIVALLASSAKTSGSRADFCEDYPGRFGITAGKTFTFVAPDDAEYFYMTLISNAVVKDGWLAEYSLIADRLYSDEEGPDRFDNPPERFAWLKAEQGSKIKWTPKKGTIQKASATTKFAAGVEQVGMPYTSCWETFKFVGYAVSWHTFMTAINNPYSLMYTECIRYGYSQSAYGKTYYGSQNSGPYYGMVCSTYTAFSLGLPVPYATGQMDDLAEAGVMEVVYDQSANGVKRSDVLWQSGHVRLIKDVWRKNGIPTKILVSEERQPQVIDNSVMTPAQFNTLLANNSMIIYRYKELFKNIEYEPTPYVAVGDETPQTVTYNNDICTFAGDMATFAEGELIYIHCLNLSYPQMEIYKDNVLIETITLATDSRVTKTSDDLAYAVNLSNDNLAYGKYKCRLKNGSTYSDYTYFEVLDVNLSVSGNTASYSSANAVAVMFYSHQYHSTSGTGPHYLVPIDKKASGSIDLAEMDFSTAPVLKVVFKGEYGMACAEYRIS